MFVYKQLHGLNTFYVKSRVESCYWSFGAYGVLLTCTHFRPFTITVSLTEGLVDSMCSHKSIDPRLTRTLSMANSRSKRILHWTCQNILFGQVRLCKYTHFHSLQTHTDDRWFWNSSPALTCKLSLYVKSFTFTICN
jgi:hypothetical protein